VQNKLGIMVRRSSMLKKVGLVLVLCFSYDNNGGLTSKWKARHSFFVKFPLLGIFSHNGDIFQLYQRLVIMVTNSS